MRNELRKTIREHYNRMAALAFGASKDTYKREFPIREEEAITAIINLFREKIAPEMLANILISGDWCREYHTLDDSLDEREIAFLSDNLKEKLGGE